MPTQIHPLLRPKEEVIEEPAAEVDPLEGGEAEAPVLETPEAPVAETVQPERRIIDLDSPNLYADIARWQNEDPRFSNQLNSLAGRHAARKYQPEMTKLQADLARANQRLQQLETQGMDEDAVKERLLKDPAFRSSYGKTEQIAPEVIELRGQIESAIAMAEDSVAGSLPPEVIQGFNSMLREGRFDAVRDARGQVTRQLSPQETLAWYGSALHQEAQKRNVKSEPAPPPPPPPAAAVVAEEPIKTAPKANTRLAQLSPDLTSSASQTGSARMAWSDYQKLNPLEKMALYPTADDVQAARQRGDLYTG